MKSHIGVELTDSPYVAVNMRIMTRMGQGALDALGAEADSLPPPRTLRVRAARRQLGGRAGGCNAENKYIALPLRRARSILRGSATAEMRCSARSAFCAVDRLGDGARRGLDGRAHGPILKRPAGEAEAWDIWGLSERVRQDEPGDADPDARGLDRRDDRRRHRVDEVCVMTAPLCDRPRSGALFGSRSEPARRLNLNAIR